MQRDHARRGRVWQDEYFDRVVREEKEFAQKFDYIQSNPWTRWPKLETTTGCGRWTVRRRAGTPTPLTWTVKLALMPA